MSLFWEYTHLELENWTPESGPSINPNPPEDFQIQRASGELQIYLRGAAGTYGGALAKGVQKLPLPATRFSLFLELRFDSSLKEYGQVLEMDTKITDSQGWTYPGDYQILVSSGQPQIGNPWQDWGTPITLLDWTWNLFRVEYELDYAKHTISINGSAPLAASQDGWAPSEIVNQLQLCSNSKAGYHTVRYRNISVRGE